MVEGVHVVLGPLAERALEAVPAFPYTGGTLADRIEPGSVILAGKHPESILPSAGAAQGWQYVGRSGEAGSDRVSRILAPALPAQGRILGQDGKPLLGLWQINLIETVEIQRR